MSDASSFILAFVSFWLGIIISMICCGDVFQYLQHREQMKLERFKIEQEWLRK